MIDALLQARRLLQAATSVGLSEIDKNPCRLRRVVNNGENIEILGRYITMLV